MRVSVGSDHRGFAVKQRIAQYLTENKHEVLDQGTTTADSCDYPDIAEKVARQVASGDAERGVLICGTGIGMAIAANKFPGILAANVHDDVSAELSRRHNDSNVLCLSADLLGDRVIESIVGIWLQTPFDGGRHARRIEKIKEFESRK